VLAADDGNGTFPISPGTTLGMVEDIMVLEYGSQEALDKIRAARDQIAAVLVEPVQSRNPSLQPAEFLKKLRIITAEQGSLLIFDEMITGFRIHPGGAQAHFGERADLATYGNIVGGGLPIGVLAGKAEYIDTVDGGMWRFGDDSYPEKEMTFFAGTFCKHPLSLAASKAVLTEMKRQGPKLQERVNTLTDYFVTLVNDYFEMAEVPVRANHFGSQFRFESFGKYDLKNMPVEIEILFYLLMSKGIYTRERRICFFSTEHTYEDADKFFALIKESIEEMRQGGFDFRSKENNHTDKKKN